MTDHNNGGRGRPRGRGGRNFTGGRGGAGRGTKMCTFCHKSGHTIDTCYKKHGYPPNYFKNTVNNYSADDEIASDDERSVISQKEVTDRTSVGLTPEQHKALMTLLQQSEIQPHHSTNQITTTFPSSSMNKTSGNICAISKLHKSNCWILDTGATDHVCCSLSKFQTYKRIKPISVKLPDGSQVVANFYGTVTFSNSLYLLDVLFTPSFSFNLISVSRLTQSLLCKLTFRKPKCEIQDIITLRMTGVAELKGGLYVLTTPKYVGSCFSMCCQ